MKSKYNIKYSHTENQFGGVLNNRIIPVIDHDLVGKFKAKNEVDLNVQC